MDDKTFLKKLGLTIQRIRKEKAITQVELGDSCDSEKSSINRIESGRTNPTILTLRKIAVGLNITVDELLKFEEKKKS